MRPSTPGSHRRGLGHQLGELHPRRGDVAQPAQRAGRRRASRPSRASGPAPRGRTRARGPARSAAKSASAANTTPEVPSATDSGPGAVDADAQGAGRLVARRRRRRGRRRRCRPDDLGRLERARQPSRRRSRARRAPRRTTSGARRRTAACPTRRRRRSPARRSAAGARSPWAAARARSAASCSGSCRRIHSSFGAVKPVSARLPVSAISRSKPTRSSISAHSARRALVVPQDRRADHPLGGVERDEPVHLAREPDRRPGARRRASPSASSRRAPPVLGVLLGPARARRRSG